MSTPLRALKDQIIVKPEFVPWSDVIETNQTIELENVLIGEVLAVGKGVRLKNGEYRPVGVEIGDRVMYTNHEEMRIEGEDLMLIHEADVFGVIE